MAGKAQYSPKDTTHGHLGRRHQNFVAQEAPAHMSAANKTWWLNQANVAYKAGGYVLCR